MYSSLQRSPRVSTFAVRSPHFGALGPRARDLTPNDVLLLDRNRIGRAEGSKKTLPRDRLAARAIGTACTRPSKRLRQRARVPPARPRILSARDMSMPAIPSIIELLGISLGLSLGAIELGVLLATGCGLRARLVRAWD
jgi:hypothetical protein